ncbi:hypothetical protein [Actinomadura keratinilytica]
MVAATRPRPPPVDTAAFCIRALLQIGVIASPLAGGVARRPGAGRRRVYDGIAALAAAGAPRDVVAVEAAMLGDLVVAAPVTAVWKVSFHTGVAAAAAVISTIVYGPALAPVASDQAGERSMRIEPQEHRCTGRQYSGRR